MAEVVLVRHGETEWSAAHLHTSYTDKDLTSEGERQARALGTLLAGRAFTGVLSSPRIRARRTADLAGLEVSTVDEDLREWEYGEYEGRTTAAIRAERPGWYLWTDGAPGGESPEQIGARLDKVVAKLRDLVLGADGGGVGGGDVAVVGHAHALRVLAARWIEQPVVLAGHLRLDTGTVSALGYEREVPVILRWNQRG